LFSASVLVRIVNTTSQQKERQRVPLAVFARLSREKETSMAK
jgi:hypothetical protein